MRLKFGEWLPDLADFENPGATLVKNVIPFQGSYLPANDFVTISDAINARARGSISALNNAGVVYTYTGNETKLYSVSQAAHTDLTNVGGAYALSADSQWKFAKYGETVIAVSIDENPQAITFGGANFADLAGSPPKAHHITVVNNFVVLGNINDGTARPQRVRWSAINDATSWTPDADTQADFQDLYSEANHGGGKIQHITGGETGTVYQEHSIWRMQYSGSPLIFTFEEVLPGVGTCCPNSVIKEGRIQHFLGQDGFYELVDGTQLTPISNNKLSRYFFDDFDATYPERVVGAADSTNQIVMWIYPGQGNINGTPNKVLYYDWYNKKWGNAELNLHWVFSSLSDGYTLEELDSINSSIDSLGVSLDSREFKGGALRISAYNDSHVKGAFTGTALDAIIETSEAQAFEGSRAHLSAVRPLVDGSATLTAQVGTRDLQTGTTAWTAASSPETDTGFCHFRSDARYHRVRVNTSGDFSHAIGVDMEAQKTGRR